CRAEWPVALRLLLQPAPHQRPEVGHRRGRLETRPPLQHPGHPPDPGRGRGGAPLGGGRGEGPCPPRRVTHPVRERGAHLRRGERRRRPRGGRGRRRGLVARGGRGEQEPCQPSAAARHGRLSSGNTASGARHRGGTTLPRSGGASMTWRALNPWSDLAGLPRDSWGLALATLVNRAGTMVIPFLALYFTRNLGFSPRAAGLALAVYGLVSLLTSPFAGQLADRVGSQRILSVSLLLGGLGFWALPLLHTLPQVLVGMVVLSAVSEAMRPATLALVSDLSPPPLRRQAFALNRLAINLGMSVGPALGGFLAARSFQTLFWVDGATSIAAALVLLLFPLRATIVESHATAPASL